jgi:medium-chain acyl-[acyl-carrier-protein] hydrolase
LKSVHKVTVSKLKSVVVPELLVNLTKTPIANNPWISCPRPNPAARLRLFFFPYAGAGSTSYFAWSRLFPAEVESYLVHLPGRDKRMDESPLTDLRSLIDSLTQSLYGLLDKPFSFFGHSMGALVSFEAARQLRKRYSRLPVHLFVSARLPPQCPALRPLLHVLPEKEFLVAAQERYGSLPSVVLADPELLTHFLSLLRADLTLMENYRYVEEAPLECPITVLGGLQDDTVSQAELSGWRRQTQAQFQLKMLPGDHFFIQGIKQTIAQIISEELRTYLQRTGQRLHQSP